MRNISLITCTKDELMMDLVLCKGSNLGLKFVRERPIRALAYFCPLTCDEWLRWTI